MTQQEFIEEARELLRPSPVCQGHVPNWFRVALMKAFPGKMRWQSTVGENVLWAVAGNGAEWLDHWGSTKFADKVMFVSEPYHFTEVDANHVAAIAKAIGCDWYVDSNSWWYPGHTIRIAFCQRDTDA